MLALQGAAEASTAVPSLMQPGGADRAGSSARATPSGSRESGDVAAATPPEALHCIEAEPEEPAAAPEDPISPRTLRPTEDNGDPAFTTPEVNTSIMLKPCMLFDTSSSIA